VQDCVNNREKTAVEVVLYGHVETTRRLLMRLKFRVHTHASMVQYTDVLETL
jgi:hypothetical protein